MQALYVIKLPWSPIRVSEEVAEEGKHVPSSLVAARRHTDLPHVMVYERLSSLIFQMQT